MCRWLSRALDEAKNSTTSRMGADKTDKTPLEVASSVLSAPPQRILENSASSRDPSPSGSVSFVSASKRIFAKTLPASLSDTFPRQAPPNPVAEPWIARAAALTAAGLPRDWAGPFAKLLCGEPPGDFGQSYWARVVDGANNFAGHWAAEAYRAGWTAADTFGLDEIKPAARHDRRGVAWFLSDGARVISLDAAGADIVTMQGSHQRFYRAPAKLRGWK